MKNLSSHLVTTLSRIGLLAAWLTLAAFTSAHADAPPTKSSLPATNSSSASTNVVNPTILITKDTDDDDSSDLKLHGHSKAFSLESHDDDSSDWPDILIPLFGIVGTFGMPVLIVFFVCYFKYRRRQENLTTVREYLNKGLPVPPQLLDQTANSDASYAGTSPKRCQSDLRRGFKLAFIGIGITLALFLDSPHSKAWVWGLIPLIMGLGYLISSWVESRLTPTPGDVQLPSIPPSGRP